MDTTDFPSWDTDAETHSEIEASLLVYNYEELLENRKHGSVEERLLRYEKELRGWEKFKPTETSMEELRWVSTGNPVFWNSIAVVYAKKAKFAAEAAGLKAEHGVAAIVKRQAKLAVIDKTGTGKMPVCISTRPKARMWASSILKQNSLTKFKNQNSGPDLRLIVDRNRRQIFKQKAKVENLLHPADFVALYMWLDGRGLIEQKENAKDATAKGR